MTADNPDPAALPEPKPSLSLFFSGLVLALIAVWMAADGVMHGLLDFRVKGIHFHLVAAENPLGFWTAEGVILFFSLFFLAGAWAALWPRRRSRAR